MLDQLPATFTVEHCTLLISTPADQAIYRCFQSIARQWKQQLTAEKLLIAGDVEMSSGLTYAITPHGVAKIFSANLDVIAHIQLEFGGLAVSYERANRSGPASARQSFVDQVKLRLEGFCTLSQAEIGQLVLLLSTCLRVSAASGTSPFRAFTEGLPIRVQSLGGEHTSLHAARLSVPPVGHRGVRARQGE
ncbi:MAG TPA: hypothetical protein VFS47_11505 [Steroidobacteraceae bacterium]|nr:hypothetical protein [Steroidobacteraceae bacterium]